MEVFAGDQAKRKVLPAWIREGLERIEQEKQRRLDSAQNPGQDNSSLNQNQANRPTERRRSKFVSCSVYNLLHKLCRIFSMM